MVQEAKRDCYGSWYLPAGRMEKGESIQEAVQREVKEEAGVDCELVTLLLVQEQGPRWIRFNFLARVTGGTLKTTSEADSESLQAQWWDRVSPLQLRSLDISIVIDAGLKFRQKQWFPACLPVDLPCAVVCQRPLLAFTNSGNPGDTEEERLWLLLDNCTADRDAERRPCLPVVVATHSVTWAAQRLVKKCMASSYHSLNVNICGILSVQHNGRIHGQTDGICFNTLATFERSEESPAYRHDPPPLETESYIWHEVTNQSLRTNILQKIKQSSLLPMHSLY
ncbi:8-oxo-dGDP phosphatase NUDT18 isoform X2 [Hoplias malabaricus]